MVYLLGVLCALFPPLERALDLCLSMGRWVSVGVLYRFLGGIVLHWFEEHPMTQCWGICFGYRYNVARQDSCYPNSESSEDESNDNDDSDGRGFGPYGGSGGGSGGDGGDSGGGDGSGPDGIWPGSKIPGIDMRSLQ